MTLAQLRYFCTAARYHSITQAANILFVTQPTVSITIQKFLRQGKCSCFFYKSMFAQLPELVGIPLDPPVETRVGLVWRRGRYMTAGMRAFLDFCKRRCKDRP